MDRARGLVHRQKVCEGNVATPFIKLMYSGSGGTRAVPRFRNRITKAQSNDAAKAKILMKLTICLRCKST